VGHIVRGGEDYFMRNQILMFQVIQSRLVFDCQNVSVTIEETEIKRVNALEGVDQFDELVFPEYAQRSLTTLRINRSIRSSSFRDIERHGDAFAETPVNDNFRVTPSVVF